MSYDLFFFRLAEGADLDEVNRLLAEHNAAVEAEQDEDEEEDEEVELDEESDDADLDEETDEDDEDDDLDDDEDEDEEDEDGQELYELLSPLIDTAARAEEMHRDLQRTYLQHGASEEPLSAEALAFVAGETDTLPAEYADELTELVDCEGSPGIQPMMFHFGAAQEAADYAAECLTQHAGHRLCVFDPQTGQVYDANSAQALVESVGPMMREVLESMGIDPDSIEHGEGCGCGHDHDHVCEGDCDCEGGCEDCDCDHEHGSDTKGA